MSSSKSFLSGDILETGVLKSYDYSAGADGLVSKARKNILIQVYGDEFDERNIKVRGIPLDHLSMWGAPKSARRLQKLSTTLAQLVRNATGKRASMLEAIDDWEDDLKWLKEEFYDLGDFDFVWPI